ncbi:MAG: threonylcarbamoyl-AMP synthase [Burkholderiales bacterium]|jgi:L-threonylcarbamoyladenylate synthase|nr:threonylcarbamoyl-AMP synthase [Burkholderiales bacterium]
MQSYNSSLLGKIRRHIKNGGVIAYPTESCYGFGCDPFNYKAIKQILKIKRRDKAKGLIIIAASVDQLNQLIAPISANDKNKLKEYWPGFYSLLMPTTDKTLSILGGKHKTLAVRVSKHDLVRQICSFINMPIVSTSANYSGHKSIKTYRECVKQFGKKVLVLPGNTNFAKKPSTIIDWKTGKTLR